MANKRTALYERHEALGARIVDFGGWDMPLHYGSQMDEHHAVRDAAGMFDVSHMTVVDVNGERARDFLRHLLANDVAKLTTRGRALYSCMLNERGGVVDDLITYYLSDEHYRLVVNAATRDKDLAWIGQHAAPFGVVVQERPEKAMIAVQGPQARERVAAALPDGLGSDALALKPFHALPDERWFVARTGYTGEDGFEVIAGADDAGTLWDKLLESDVQPAGLGARDTLRLEAGLHLYGSDMDEDISPLGVGLGWTVAWDPDDRDFVGRGALLAERAQGVETKQVGLLLTGRGVLRAGQKVYSDAGEGIVTSGTFSPTLKRSIALARVPASIGDDCEVDIRGKRIAASVHAPCFVRNGKAKIELPED